MTNSGILQKYQELKEAALWTNMIEEVKLVDTLEAVFVIMDDVKSRSLMIFLDNASMYTDDDYIRMTVIIADKINQVDNEELILQSYDNGLAAIKVMLGKLNYYNGQSVVLEDIGLSVYRPDGTDWLATTITVPFNFAVDIVPNINPIVAE